MDELPEAAKRARLMELHIQASARPNCASVPYYPGEGLPYVALVPCCRLECQARGFRVASRAPSNTAVLRCRSCCSIWSSAAARCPAWDPTCLLSRKRAAERRLNTTILMLIHSLPAQTRARSMPASCQRAQKAGLQAMLWTSVMATPATPLHTKQTPCTADTQEHTRMGGQDIGPRDRPCTPTLMRTRRAGMSPRLLAMVQRRAPPRALRGVVNP